MGFGIDMIIYKSVWELICDTPEEAEHYEKLSKEMIEFGMKRWDEEELERRKKERDES